MGLVQSGTPIQFVTQAFTNVISAGDDLIKLIKTNLKLSGWVRTATIPAHITYTAVGIAGGDTVTLDGDVFTFYVTTPSGTNPVPIGGSNHNAVVNLGATVLSVKGWTSVVTGDAITFTVPNDPDHPEDTHNILPCSLTAPGASAIYDYNPEAIAGNGRTWGGGYTMTSLAWGTTPLKINLFTSGTRTCDITIESFDEIGVFTGLQVPSTWSLVCNGYQFFLFVLGTYTAGNYMLASNLKQVRTLGFANLISGPANPVVPSGGARGNFQDIVGRYYVQTTDGAYFSSGTGSVNEDPCHVFPGFGSGVTPLQKLFNRIAAIDLVRDDGKGIPYDAFMGACLTDPGLSSTSVRILGRLSDALFYSIKATKDTAANINGRDAMVLLSQDGNTDSQRGSLVIQTET